MRRHAAGVVPALYVPFLRLVARPDFASCYREYLFLLHSVLRAAVPLMRTAQDQLTAGREDPVATRVSQYFQDFIPAEEGHERWVLEDLALLGVTADVVQARMPSPHVAAAVGSQYYWIHHHDPVALLGYIGVLEGYPQTASEVGYLIERSGLPPASFRTLRRHAHLDVDHRRQYHALLDELPLTDDQVSLICTSATTTARMLGAALTEVATSVPTIGPEGAEDRSAR